MRATGPGGLIVAGPVVVLDADTAAAVVDLVDLDAVRRRLFGRDPVADNALAAIVALGRIAERKRAAPEEMCSADVPGAGASSVDRGWSGAMVSDTAAELDVAAVASKLKVGDRAVRGLAERRTLPGRKVAGEWRFASADVEQLADRRAQRRRSA